MFAGYSLGDIGSIMAMQGFAGLILFSVFVLMALGLAVIFGQMGVINMAHGEFMILGAYVTFLTSKLFTTYLPAAFGIYFFVAIVLAFIVAGALGMLVERVLISRLYKRPLDTLLATWGLSLILQQVYRSAFGAREVGVDQPDWMMGATNLTDTIQIPINGLIVMALTTVISVAVYWLIFRMGWGKQVRAVMANRAMASAVGIDTERVDRVTFGIGCGIAGRGGQRLHHDRLHEPDRRAALHRRHLPDRGVRRRGQPRRHHRVRLHHQPGALDARVLPQRLDGAGDRAAGGDRHPDDPAAGLVRPQSPALRGLP